jgi:predicted regulator of Ras-like GTPase activity (Roadblock/LC7/MglB family)
VTTVADPTLTPELALTYLGELSTDIRASAVIDANGSVAAQAGFDEDGADGVSGLVAELFDNAALAAEAGAGPDQIEVSLPEGVVFAVRDKGWTLAVVAGRFALASLMFFDLRMVIRDLEGAAA